MCVPDNPVKPTADVCTLYFFCLIHFYGAHQNA